MFAIKQISQKEEKEVGLIRRFNRGANVMRFEYNLINGDFCPR